MSIGDQPVFPEDVNTLQSGMTYRQLLIAEIANGQASDTLDDVYQPGITKGTFEEWKTRILNSKAQYCLNFADVIIALLDGEER